MLLIPHGIILTPTYELSYQLSHFAESLLHEFKFCTSQANIKSYRQKDLMVSKMASAFKDVENDSMDVFEVMRINYLVNLVVGTAWPWIG